MAAIKNRLGRGLGVLIAGGTPAIQKNVKKNQPKLIEKTAKKTVATPTKPKAPVRPQAPLKAKKGVKTAVEPVQKTPVSLPKTTTFSDLKITQLPDYLELAVDKIDHNPHQPRRDMDAEKIQELADSIRAEGLLQPIVVRPVGERYQLIAGERRLRACQLMGLKTIACRILKVSNASSAVLALIENLQREGLNPIDESMGYASLMRDFDLTQEAVAERMGKNRSTIANALRLLQLDREIQAYLAKNLISTGHAKVIAGIEDSAQQVLLARRILEEGLSVRQTEELARRLKAPQNNRLTPVGQSPSIDPSIQQLERHISQSLGAKVLLKHTDKKGRLVIEYYGPQDLQRILEKTGLGHVSFSL